MLGFFLFGLTVLVYLGIGLFAFQPAPSGTDQTYGWAYSVIVLIGAYGVCSLLLTIYIASKGGFNWISDAKLLRNGMVALLWLGMVLGVAYCTHKPTFHNAYQLTGFARLLSYLISYGSTWLPLLMLIPYYFLLKPEWRDSFYPNFLKIILTVASVIGFLLPLAPKIIKRNYKAFDQNELAFNQAMNNIQKYQTVMALLYYTSQSYDQEIRNAAMTKIKSYKNLEDQLIQILEQSSPYAVFNFLDENKVENPERFTEPIIKGISTIITDMHEQIINPYKGIYDLEVILRVLEGQFKVSSAAFKPHILRLQEVLQTPPAKSRAYDSVEKCNQTLYKNQELVKNWLAKH